MNVKELFKGVAVIIDDEIKNKSASIQPILQQLEGESIPYVGYEALPNIGIVENLQNVSFILLDWKLDIFPSDDDKLSGLKTPSGLSDFNDSDNIEFLKAVHARCFCPIFIFTNEDVTSIEKKLNKQGLYDASKSGVFLIKPKSDFSLNGSLFRELENWLKKNASIYLLKEWDAEYQKAKSNLFIDFQKRSPLWPKILWDTYKSDDVNPSYELGDFISRSIQSQMHPLHLDEQMFENIDRPNDPKELIGCLERQCFVSKEFLDKEKTDTGDIFQDGKDYYINIRPCCDLIPHEGSCSDDEILLYLLKGSKGNKSQFQPKYGHFEERHDMVTIFPLSEKVIQFKFKELVIAKWGEKKNERIGRLLHPYLTKIQMKYGAYLQRQGWPKLPKELFPSVAPQENEIERQVKENDYSLKDIFHIVGQYLKKRCNLFHLLP